MQSSQLEAKPNLKAFDLIIEAAKNKDPVKLYSALELAAIDVWDGSTAHAPITRLAAQGDKPSVDFLLAFGGSLAEAAYGYSQAHLKKEAYEILELVQRTSNDQINYVEEKLISGFAQSGKQEDLLKLWKNSSTQNMYRIKGLIFGQFLSEAYQFLKEVIRKDRNQTTDMLDSMAYSLARTGDEYNVNKFLIMVQEEHPTQLNKVLEYIGFGYAVTGDLKKTEPFLAMVRGKHPTAVMDVLLGFIQGFGKAGNIPQIFEMLKIVKVQHPDVLLDFILNLVIHIAMGGHKNVLFQVLDRIKKEYLSEADYKEVLARIPNGFLMGHHDIAANEFLLTIKKDAGNDSFFIATALMASTFASQGRKKEAYDRFETVSGRFVDADCKQLLLSSILEGFVHSQMWDDVWQHVALVRKEYPDYFINFLMCAAVSFCETNKSDYLLEKLSENCPKEFAYVVPVIAEEEKKHGRCIAKRHVLKGLVMLAPDERLSFATHLKPYINDYDTVALVEKAQEVYNLMKQYKLDCNQALAWPQMHTVLVQGMKPGVQLTEKLPLSVLSQVFSFLSVTPICDMSKLSNEVTWKTYASRFFANLNSERTLLLRDQKLAHLLKKPSQRKIEQADQNAMSGLCQRIT